MNKLNQVRSLAWPRVTARAASVFSAGVVMALLITGCQVKRPGSFEASVATQVKRHLTVGGKAERNPLAPTEETIHAGQKSFSNYCMVCHGLDGQGTGVPFAENMYPPVPSLKSRQVQGYTDGQLHWIIDNGIGPSGMPAARGILNNDEIWSIVAYIRHLPAKGSLGGPAVYGGSGK